MEFQNSVEAFIRLAREDESIQARLADCAIESWGSAHLPLDVDVSKVIAVAADYGFRLTTAGIVQSQCEKLSEFWRFEMENAFVARRAMSLIQYRLYGEDSDLDYYQLCEFSGNGDVATGPLNFDVTQ